MDTQQSPSASVFSPSQPAPPTTPAPKGRENPAVIIAVVAGVLAAGYLSYAYFSGSGPFGSGEPSASESPSPSASASPTTDPTAGWKEFILSSARFSVRLPPIATISSNSAAVFADIDGDEKNGDELAITSETLAAGQAFEQYNFLDFPLSGTAIVGGYPARVVKAPKGYCDGPACSRPFIAYSVSVNSRIFTIEFYGDDSMSQVETQILGTFRFTAETAGWKTYNSSTLGISFDYDPKRYADPQETGEGVSVPNYYESPPSIEGGLYISLLNSVPASYIDQEAERIRENSECQIVSEQPVRGVRTLWYKCSGKGDMEEVLIRHPYRDGVLRIQTLFSGPAELVGSLTFTK